MDWQPKSCREIALAVFTYSTDGRSWKEDVNFPSEGDVFSWNDGLSKEDENNMYWTGYYCESTKLALELRQIRLNGTIPWELSLLSDLFSIESTRTRCLEQYWNAWEDCLSWNPWSFQQRVDRDSANRAGTTNSSPWMGINWLEHSQQKSVDG